MAKKLCLPVIRSVSISLKIITELNALLSHHTSSRDETNKMDVKSYNKANDCADFCNESSVRNHYNTYCLLLRSEILLILIDFICHFQNNGYINMYDNVKRRHETPTPEKKQRNCNAEDDDGDDEDDDNDVNESDDDEEEEEEDDQQIQENKYLLRKRKPMVNRYMAPPMRKTEGKPC